MTTIHACCLCLEDPNYDQRTNVSRAITHPVEQCPNNTAEENLLDQVLGKLRFKNGYENPLTDDELAEHILNLSTISAGVADVKEHDKKTYEKIQKAILSRSLSLLEEEAENSLREENEFDNSDEEAEAYYKALELRRS